MACKYLDFRTERKSQRCTREEARVLDIAYKIGCPPQRSMEELRRGDTGKLDKNQRPEYDPPPGSRTFQEAIRRRGNRRDHHDRRERPVNQRGGQGHENEGRPLRTGNVGENGFTLDGVEFVKLEDDMDAAFAVAADTLPECCQFEDDDAEREGHNNYAGSLLSKTVGAGCGTSTRPSFLRRGGAAHRPDHHGRHDGLRQAPGCRAGADHRRVPQAPQHPAADLSKPYWLATGWTNQQLPRTRLTAARTTSNTDGTVSGDYMYHACFAPRPALYLKSFIPCIG